jgi:hypothetical protein
MEITALPVPLFPYGSAPGSQGNTARQPAGRQEAGLPVRGGAGGVPDEVVLQGEVLRNNQYTYSKPETRGDDLEGEASREHRSRYSYPQTPVDPYSLRSAIDAYKENAEVNAGVVQNSLHQIDVYV